MSSHTHPLVTVGGLIIAPDGDLLLVRSKKWRDLYSLPGGKVEWGESREAAFVREIWEETGLKITNLRFAIVQDCIFSPEFWQKRHFVMNDFIADLDPSCSKKDVKLNEEAYVYEWISPRLAIETLNLHHECRILIEWYLKQLHLLPKTSFGILGIQQHEIKCIVGVYPKEREHEQSLFIDAKIKVDFSRCLASGQVEDTIDYVMLAKICSQLAQENQYYLLENFASDILDQFFKRFHAIWAWVRIEKPSAIPTARSAYIELERYREKE